MGGRHRLATALLPFALWLVLADVARAQSAPPGRLEVSFDAGWIASTGLDSEDATETRPGGGTLQLFAIDTSLESVFYYGPRVSVRLNNTLQLEGGGSIGRGGLQVTITDDFELPEDTTIGEDLKQLLIEGGVLFQLAGKHNGARTQPFVNGGAGFFWDVHEGDTVSETGQLFYVGGGLKHALMLRTQPRATVKALGIRLDARLILRTGGAVSDDNVHAMPAVSAGLFVRF